MKIWNGIGPSLGLAGILALAACASSAPQAPVSQPGVVYSGADRPWSGYSGNGVVQSITPVQKDYQGVGGSGYGLGTLAGAVIGGVAGNQVGGGKGKTAATVAGTAGGAYVGHQIEKRNQGPDSYSFSVRMDNGSYQTLTQATTGSLNVGDRVRIENGFMQRY